MVGVERGDVGREALSHYFRGIRTTDFARGDTTELQVEQMRNKVAISKAEFDSYADQYEELLAHSIKISGEKPEYFAAHKASYPARPAQEISCICLPLRFRISRKPSIPAMRD